MFCTNCWLMRPIISCPICGVDACYECGQCSDPKCMNGANNGRR